MRKSSRKKIKVVIFAGGRGSANIINALSNYDQIELDVLVNAYDDGLSTGRLRKFIPGLLGPSDIRKNICTLIPKHDASKKNLVDLLEYRFSKKISHSFALKTLTQIVNLNKNFNFKDNFHILFSQINSEKFFKIALWLKIFLDYEKKFKENFDFKDASFGNIIFSGCFIENNFNFNKTIQNFSSFCEITNRVLNLTDGKNLVLTGLKENGQILFDEASIVSPQNKFKIIDIFLLEKYLTKNELKKLDKLELNLKNKFLSNIEVFPNANPECLKSIAETDLIIYGPGTQFSSLFPSYLTKGINESIANNKSALKIFITNLHHDYDIQGLGTHDILNKFSYFMNLKKDTKVDYKKYISTLFIHKSDTTKYGYLDDSKNLEYIPNKVNLNSNSIYINSMEDSSGKHFGGRVVDEILYLTKILVNNNIKPFRHTLSIVLAVNNDSHSVSNIIKNIFELDLSQHQINKEIIVVDYGLNLQSLSKLKELSGISLFKISNSNLRGDAIRFGLKKVNGNLVTIFPPFLDYNVDDILKVIDPIISNDFKLVLGNRSIKIDDVNETIKKIYGRNYIMRLVSKYGGLLTSTLFLILFKKNLRLFKS